ncbi:MAG TPA: YfhO family protein [Pyrinomonadaceae bacterium]|nr:YfhO family protein [Pyrinomonadaceae bacterium]
MSLVNAKVKASARHCLLVVLFYSLLFTLFFSPVLFYDSLLAPGGGRLGDGLLYHLTYFQSPKLFWDSLLGAGFPMAADPQVMAWYPPSMLLSLFPGTWNLFVVSAYVMASCFTYGYVYALTASRLSGFVGGIVYGMCGFMLAHLGHTAIIHVAAWVPLIIWSLEMLRRKFSAAWLAISCGAVACLVLAGHLQIVAYGLLLGSCYAAILGWKAPAGRRNYYLVSLLLFVLGLGLSALQILPAAELAASSDRTVFAFADFVSYSLPLKQSAALLYPAAFGGLAHYGTTPYFGAWNLTELTGYVGLLPLMLAATGFIASRREAVSLFWLSAGLVAFLLALGDQTPLAYLTYHLPVVNKFRAPARHFIEMALAVSVLAGIGTQAILRLKVSKQLLVKIVLVGAALMIGGLLLLLLNHSAEFVVPEGGTVRPNLLPWANPAVATPLIIFILTALVLLYWQRDPASSVRKAALLVALTLDLASFGWFYSWHDYAPRKSILSPPLLAADYGNRLRATHQRMLPVRGTLGTIDELPPNISRLWDVPSAGGYGPLSLSRMNQFLSLRADASLDPSWKNTDNQSLNLLAVRYVFLPRAAPLKDERGVQWDPDDMNLWLGAGCDQPVRNSVRFDLPAPIRATSLGIVSRLACSPGIPEGTEVVRITLRDAAGNAETKSMLAGRDTSEWAYDCRTVKPEMKHERAAVFRSFAAEMKNDPCQGHFYVTTLGLEGEREVSSLELSWTGRPEAISIEKLTLIDALAQESVPLSPLALGSNKWRYVTEAGTARVYENLQANPRAWLVFEALILTPEEILTAIKTSRLPDGRVYDPLRQALIEDSSPLSTAEAADPAATVEVARVSDRLLEVQTSSAYPSLLVTSDVYYPNWEVTVDGTPARLLRANYLLRGVRVPAGRHVLRFEFRPKSFYFGAGISLFSLAALAGFLALRPSLRKSRKSQLLS